jgi:hypothetical protein
MVREAITTKPGLIFNSIDLPFSGTRKLRSPINEFFSNIGFSLSVTWAFASSIRSRVTGIPS